MVQILAPTSCGPGAGPEQKRRRSATIEQQSTRNNYIENLKSSAKIKFNKNNNNHLLNVLINKPQNIFHSVRQIIELTAAAVSQYACLTPILASETVNGTSPAIVTETGIKISKCQMSFATMQHVCYKIAEDTKTATSATTPTSANNREKGKKKREKTAENKTVKTSHNKYAKLLNAYTRVRIANISSVAIKMVNKAVASRCFFTIALMLTIWSQTAYPVAAEKSKHYYMQSLCKNHFLQQLYRKIDGAVLWSQNERNLDCIITFQTQSILQRFMLRFDMLQLDCNDHLYVYDGAHAVSAPKVDISCRNTKQTVSSILTRTNFVTLKYVTDNWGTDANGFKLIITSVRDPKHTCKDFTCATRDFCIHPDLLCDGINHCGDNSDESVQNLCQNETSSSLFGMDSTWFVLIVVCVLLILSTFVVGISICACRRQDEASANNANMTSIQLHPGAETNGSSKYLHHYQVYGGTLTREHTQIPTQLSTSGNWHHPAGLLGYLRIPLKLLKMDTRVRLIWCLGNFVN